MPEALDAMKMALRVLTAITEKQPPEPADVEGLRLCCARPATAPLDELACEVIQQGLRFRAEVRSRFAS